MKAFIHKECLGVRGIKFFKCEKCGADSTNYSNGVNICHECCIKSNTCEVCGKKMINLDIEKDELYTFKRLLNSQIQRLDLSKEEVIGIVESLYN